MAGTVLKQFLDTSDPMQHTGDTKSKHHWKVDRFGLVEVEERWKEAKPLQFDPQKRNFFSAGELTVTKTVELSKDSLFLTVKKTPLLFLNTQKMVPSNHVRKRQTFLLVKPIHKVPLIAVMFPKEERDPWKHKRSPFELWIDVLQSRVQA